MTKIKLIDQISAGEGTKELEFSYASGGNVKWYQLFGKILILWKMLRVFPGGLVAKTLHSGSREPRSVPSQGTRSHMLQLRPSEDK